MYLHLLHLTINKQLNFCIMMQSVEQNLAFGIASSQKPALGTETQ